MAFDLIAQDMAISARRTATFRLRPVPRVAFLGDSLTRFGMNDSGTVVQWTGAGYLGWLRWLLGDRMAVDQELVVAVAGTRTDHLLAVQVPQAIRLRPDFVIIQDGTNDIGVLPAERSIANLTAAVTALNGAGIAVVLLALTP